MAFVVVNHDETVPLADQLKTFLVASDEGVNPIPGGNFAGVKQNLDFSMMKDETMMAAQLTHGLKAPFVLPNLDLLLPAPSAKETVRVFLRVKPMTANDNRFSESDKENLLNQDGSEHSVPEDDGFSIISLETDYQIALHAPNESHTYKNCMNGAGTLTHRYSFTKVFPPDTNQESLFREMVLPRLQDFLQGQNQLLFTYGATSSGKTFTIQGTKEHPGIVPRALDVLFNSVGARLVEMDDESGPLFKPFGFGGVARMKTQDSEKLRSDKRNIVELGCELVTAAQSHTNDESFFSTSTASQHSLHEISLQSLATMFPQMKNRVRDTGRCSDALSNDTEHIKYSVWISFAEIYNENIHDLLEKLPEAKHKGDKPRRLPLKLAEDRGGAVYIKGLKEVPVSSADEAYQLLMIGRQNLQFAATRLNQHSSRSHCIFTIKIIRVVDTDQPHLARTSMLSFCDLAGSERIKKTLNTGERQKEAGNINTSLLVLGRCIKALRHNQITKDARKQQLVPFRDSKLTRLFQSYFTGRGKASMVVNIGQSPYLFDESLQVLKFSAIASKVTVDTSKQDLPLPKKAKAQQENKRKTRFSILMEKKAPGKSLLDGRGSIAWEKPPVSSTMVRGPSSEFAGFGSDQNNTIVEASEEADVTPTDQTVIDNRYDGLLNIIEGLEKKLVAEKEKNMDLEKKLDKIEVEVRKEISEDFNRLMVSVEQSWEQRLQQEIDRAQENNEWRVNKLQDAHSQRRKRARMENDVDEAKSKEQAGKISELQSLLEDKQKDLSQMESKVTAMKDVHKSVHDELQSVREQLSTKEFEFTSEVIKNEELQAKINALNKDLAATNRALEEQTTDPKVQELQTQLDQLKVSLEEKEKNCAEHVHLLNEASEEYVEKDKEIKTLKEKVTNVMVSFIFTHKD